MSARDTFRSGDLVQLTGPKGRLQTIILEPGRQLHSHRGTLDHDTIIGREDGSVVSSATGVQYLALRPRLHDFVLSMPRGAAIVYPKDAAHILAIADVGPGATVAEAGVGSGALSLWLLRAVGASGRLFSFERRAEFADVARGNVATFHGAEPANWSITVGDVVETLVPTVGAGGIDRLVLDLLAPWDCLEVAAVALRPGGILLAYLTTVTQLSRTAEAIRETGRFTEPEAVETLVRGWHLQALAVRPDHRMIAHTGFLLTARLLAPGAKLPTFVRRAPKTEYTDKDVELDTGIGRRAFDQRQAVAKTCPLSRERRTPSS